MNGVIYARYSSDNQREESIEGQLRECKQHCIEQDFTIISFRPILLSLTARCLFSSI